MFVKVSVTGGVQFEDRDNFRAFKLVVEGGRTKLDAVRQTLAGIAELPDPDTAWVFEAALRRWPEAAQDVAWQQGLTEMIEKAKPYGWIDAQRKAIKAHVEWLEPPA
jgi:hypothetical protein